MLIFEQEEKEKNKPRKRGRPRKNKPEKPKSISDTESISDIDSVSDIEKEVPILKRSNYGRKLVIGDAKAGIVSPIELRHAVEFEKLAKKQRENLFEEGLLCETEKIKNLLKAATNKHYGGLILKLLELADLWTLRFSLTPTESRKIKDEIKTAIQRAWDKVKKELREGVEI